MWTWGIRKGAWICLLHLINGSIPQHSSWKTYQDVVQRLLLLFPHVLTEISHNIQRLFIYPIPLIPDAKLWEGISFQNFQSSAHFVQYL